VPAVLRWSDDGVDLTVSDDRRADNPAGGPDVPSGGYGLTGLRERAELVGGTLQAGPTATGLRVTLSLPLVPHPEGPLQHADEGAR
jgi:signal transduction histidine kinase